MPSPAAATTASARLRWYVRASGAWDHHRVSHLPSFRAQPTWPAAAEGADSPAASVVIATMPTQQAHPLRIEYCAARPVVLCGGDLVACVCTRTGDRRGHAVRTAGR